MLFAEKNNVIGLPDTDTEQQQYNSSKNIEKLVSGTKLPRNPPCH